MHGDHGDGHERAGRGRSGRDSAGRDSAGRDSGRDSASGDAAYPTDGAGGAKVTDLGAIRAARARQQSPWGSRSPGAATRADDAEPPTPADFPTRLEALAKAEQRVLERLRRADRSREELRRELAADESLDEGGIDDLLERLAELGYIDDERMAEALADKLLDRKGKGIEGVRRELRSRLLDDVAIAAALEGRERDDEFARAAALAASRADRLRGLDRDVAIRRLTGFLQRRGFGSGVALIAAGEAIDAVDRPSRQHRGTPVGGVYFGNVDDSAGPSTAPE